MLLNKHNKTQYLDLHKIQLLIMGGALLAAGRMKVQKAVLSVLAS